MDISDTILANSDQLNAEDLLTGPVTVTIENVSRGSKEQPVNIRLKEFPGKTYRPSKGMRKVLVRAWGKDAKQYVGRRMTLFREPSVTYGGQAVGGIRIGALSHLDKPLETKVRTARTKYEPFTIQPLPTEPVGASDAVAAFSLKNATLSELQDAWRTADPATKKRIEARAAELQRDESEAS